MTNEFTQDTQNPPPPSNTSRTQLQNCWVKSMMRNVGAVATENSLARLSRSFEGLIKVSRNYYETFEVLLDMKIDLQGNRLTKKYKTTLLLKLKRE